MIEMWPGARSGTAEAIRFWTATTCDGVNRLRPRICSITEALARGFRG